MKEISIVGLDLAKRVFQVHARDPGWLRHSKGCAAVSTDRRRVRRSANGKDKDR